jgi:hypothetical protein
MIPLNKRNHKDRWNKDYNPSAFFYEASNIWDKKFVILNLYYRLLNNKEKHEKDILTGFYSEHENYCQRER